MKWFAISLNVLAIAFLAYMLADQGMPKRDDEILILVFAFAVPAFNLLALLGKGGESWLEYYLKRKTLEEKQIIAKLTRSTEE